MAHRAACRASLPLALIALLAQVAFAAGSTKLFVCDSVPRLECCCADGIGGQLPTSHEELRSRCCCETVELSVGRRPVAEPVRDRAVGVSKMLAIIPGFAAAAYGHRRLAAGRAELKHAEPLFSIPILLRKQSLLI